MSKILTAVAKLRTTKVSFKVAKDKAHAQAKAHRAIEVPFDPTRMWESDTALLEDAIATWTVKCQSHLRKNWGDVKKLNATALAFQSGATAGPVVVLQGDTAEAVIKSLQSQGITVVLEKEPESTEESTEEEK